MLTMGGGPLSAAQPDKARAAIAAQSRAFMAAMERGDSRAAAELFTADAKIIVSGVDDVVAGREAIGKFWQAAVGNGIKGLRLTTIDLEGDGPLRVETGSYQALGASGELGRGDYLFVWKQEAGAWKIHRDLGRARTTPAVADSAPDRVGFPRDYRTALKLLSVSVKEGEALVMTTYGNELAASVTQPTQMPYPYGTVIAVEFSRTMRDGEGQVLYDGQGAPLKGEVARVDVMRRERGYGEVYGESRAGEWEFASYRPDGTTMVSPANSASCATCHL
ncbi:MAG: cytochrome P460 family protein, partial [Peristeroidobacter soli]